MTDPSRPTRPASPPIAAARAPLASRPLNPIVSSGTPPPLPVVSVIGPTEVAVKDVKDDRIGKIEPRLGELERERDDTKRRDELRVLIKMALEDAMAPVLRWQDAADERYAREQLARGRDSVVGVAASPVRVETRIIDRGPPIAIDDLPSEMDGGHRRRSAAVWAMAIILIIVTNLATAMVMSRSH